MDTLLCCVCEDMEVNDGTMSREFLMSVGLMDAIRNCACQLNKLSAHSRAEYSASIIIDHDLRRNKSYKRDKRLLAESSH
jgi:hypothetical protein